MIKETDPEADAELQKLDREHDKFVSYYNERRAKMDKLKGKVNPKTGKLFNYDYHYDKLKDQAREEANKYQEDRSKVFNDAKAKKLHELDDELSKRLEETNNLINKYSDSLNKYKSQSAVGKVKTVLKHDKKEIKKAIDFVKDTVKGGIKVAKVTTAPLRKVAKMSKESVDDQLEVYDTSYDDITTETSIEALRALNYHPNPKYELL